MCVCMQIKIIHIIISEWDPVSLEYCGEFLTKVGQFELACVADEQVLWFQVPVKDVALMDVRQTPQ